jgi:hypothetical protein
MNTKFKAQSTKQAQNILNFGFVLDFEFWVLCLMYAL